MAQTAVAKQILTIISSSLVRNPHSSIWTALRQRRSLLQPNILRLLSHKLHRHRDPLLKRAAPGNLVRSAALPGHDLVAGLQVAHVRAHGFDNAGAFDAQHARPVLYQDPQVALLGVDQVEGDDALPDQHLCGGERGFGHVHDLEGAALLRALQLSGCLCCGGCHVCGAYVDVRILRLFLAWPSSEGWLLQFDGVHRPYFIYSLADCFHESSIYHCIILMLET